MCRTRAKYRGCFSILPPLRLTCVSRDKVIMVDASYLNEVSSVSEFSQDEINVLKKINVLGKATPESLTRELGEPYTVQDLSSYLKSLEAKTLLSRTQENHSAYKLTPQGLVAIGVLPESTKKIYSAVPREKCFYFYTGVGPEKFTKMSACSLSDFKEKAEKVDLRSLEFHTQRGDIARWFKDVLGEPELAKEFDRLRMLNVYGEVLRTRMARLIDARIERLSYSRTRV
jgi:DNA-binding HxlR family transcriptional regulator